MAEIKVDTDTIPEHIISDQKLPKPKRVASVDIFRGLTVAVLFQSFFFFIYIFSVKVCELMSGRNHVLFVNQHFAFFISPFVTS